MTRIKQRPLKTSYQFVPGTISNDVEVLFLNIWITVSSVSVTNEKSLFWKSEFYLGNCPKGMWRVK